MSNAFLLRTFASLCLTVIGVSASERPYFITYDQTMEEPGTWKSR